MKTIDSTLDPQDIKNNELTFQLIVESTPNAIILLNKDGKIVYANSKSEMLFGYTRSELIGQLVEILIPKRYHENHPGFREMFFKAPSVRAMGAGRELFAARKDKSEFPVEIGLNAVVTVEGTLVLVSIIDITEWKRSKDELQKTIKAISDYKYALDQSSTVTITNQNGIIIYINENFCKISKYSEEELIGQDNRIVNSGYHSKEFIKELWVAITNGKVWKGELKNKAKDGTVFWLDTTIIPFLNSEGKPYQYVAIRSDITERKMQESIIEEHLTKLKIKNKELEQFTYIASHDLQEPLRTISNYLQIFEEDYSEQLDEDANNHLKTIKDANQRMRTLVKALLDYSRLGKDRSPVSINSKTIIDNAIADLGTLILSSGARIKVEAMPELKGYEIELRQIFQNLITNAIKFQKKGHKPEIEILSEKLDGKWKFSIKDNGIGIEPQYFEKIFQIFQRLDTVEMYQGNGIGLANCKKIVELHQGKIWVESVLGEGTTFHFTI